MGGRPPAVVLHAMIVAMLLAVLPSGAALAQQFRAPEFTTKPKVVKKRVRHPFRPAMPLRNPVRPVSVASPSDDAATKAQFLDAAEHSVNGVPGIPPWFDEVAGLFQSMYLGTRGVRTEPGMELNLPDHLRYINLCLLAHQMGGGEHYLDFAARYAGKWADAILAGDVLPVGLLPSGPVYDLAGEAEVAYRSFAGMAGHLDDDVDRAENLLASNGTGAFLALWLERGWRRADLDDTDKLQEAIEFAVRAAAINCTRAGAEPPARAEMGLA